MSLENNPAFPENFGNDEKSPETLKAFKESMSALEAIVSNYEDIEDQLRATLERMYDQGWSDRHWKDHPQG